MDGVHLNRANPNPAQPPVAPSPSHTAQNPTRSKKNLRMMRWFKGLSFIVLCGIALIILLVIIYAVVGHFQGESSYIDRSEYQGVAVNIAGTSGGQFYFGHITDLTTRYITLTDVFYLEPGQSSNQFTLNNFTCALYKPNDQMVINRDQVAYWVNLSPSGQLTQDINKWKTDNIQCSSNSSTATSGSTSTGSTSTGTKTP